MALPTRVLRGHLADPGDVQREFDTLLGRFFGNREGNGGTYLANYAVDIREDADHFFVDVELPGFKKDEIEIMLENATLTIRAERKSETRDQKQGDWLLHERRYARFERSFTLPPTVDEQSVNAKLSEGILSITINKREESKPRKISVS